MPPKVDSIGEMDNTKAGHNVRGQSSRGKMNLLVAGQKAVGYMSNSYDQIVGDSSFTNGFAFPYGSTQALHGLNHAHVMLLRKTVL